MPHVGCVPAGTCPWDAPAHSGAAQGSLHRKCPVYLKCLPVGNEEMDWLDSCCHHFPGGCATLCVAGCLCLPAM